MVVDTLPYSDKLPGDAESIGRTAVLALVLEGTCLVVKAKQVEFVKDRCVALLVATLLAQTCS